MPSTTKHGLPYPQGTDPVDIPGDIGGLATALDVIIATADAGPLSSRPVSTVGTPGKVGRFYYTTDEGVAYLDIGTAWVPLNPPVPAGVIWEYAADPPAPTGWLMADWSLQPTATYPALFAKVGHKYNGGTDPGGGQFRVPDMRGRSPMGAGSGPSLTARALGAALGTETHGHSASGLLPNHAHGHSLSMQDHTHGITTALLGQATGGVNAPHPASASSGGASALGINGGISGSGDLSVGVSVGAGSTIAPVTVVNFIVKT